MSRVDFQVHRRRLCAVMSRGTSTAGWVPYAPPGVCLANPTQFPEAPPQPQWQTTRAFSRLRGESHTLCSHVSFYFVSWMFFFIFHPSYFLTCFLLLLWICDFRPPTAPLVTTASPLQQRAAMDSDSQLHLFLTTICIYSLCKGTTAHPFPHTRILFPFYAT